MLDDLLITDSQLARFLDASKHLVRLRLAHIHHISLHGPGKFRWRIVFDSMRRRSSLTDIGIADMNGNDCEEYFSEYSPWGDVEEQILAYCQEEGLWTDLLEEIWGS